MQWPRPHRPQAAGPNRATIRRSPSPGLLTRDLSPVEIIAQWRRGLRVMSSRTVSFSISSFTANSIHREIMRPARETTLPKNDSMSGQRNSRDLIKLDSPTSARPNPPLTRNAMQNQSERDNWRVTAGEEGGSPGWHEVEGTGGRVSGWNGGNDGARGIGSASRMTGGAGGRVTVAGTKTLRVRRGSISILSGSSQPFGITLVFGSR